MIWRFSDQAQKWRASLASGFITLETADYASRNAFLHRLSGVLQAVEQSLKPQVTTRIGLRYINRLTGAAYENIEHMVRKEVLGLIATSLAPHLGRMLSEALLDAEDGRLSVRWGKVPARVTVPGLPIEAIETPSWILDIDMYDDSPEQRFEAEGLIEIAQAFAERIYSVFHWTVTDELFRHYGGNP